MSWNFVEDLTRWLVSRQTLLLLEDEELHMVEEDVPDPDPPVFPPRFHVMGSSPAKVESPVALEFPSIEIPSEKMLYVGVNGRCNKVADTCYTFWVGGSLSVSLFLGENYFSSSMLKSFGFLDTQQSMAPGF